MMGGVQGMKHEMKNNTAPVSMVLPPTPDPEMSAMDVSRIVVIFHGVKKDVPGS